MLRRSSSKRRAQDVSVKRLALIIGDFFAVRCANQRGFVRRIVRLQNPAQTFQIDLWSAHSELPLNLGEAEVRLGLNSHHRLLHPAKFPC